MHVWCLKYGWSSTQRETVQLADRRYSVYLISLGLEGQDSTASVIMLESQSIVYICRHLVYMRMRSVTAKLSFQLSTSSLLPLSKLVSSVKRTTNLWEPNVPWQRLNYWRNLINVEQLLLAPIYSGLAKWTGKKYVSLMCLSTIVYFLRHITRTDLPWLENVYSASQCFRIAIILEYCYKGGDGRMS